MDMSFDVNTDTDGTRFVILTGRATARRTVQDIDGGEWVEVDSSGEWVSLDGLLRITKDTRNGVLSFTAWQIETDAPHDAIEAGRHFPTFEAAHAALKTPAAA